MPNFEAEGNEQTNDVVTESSTEQSTEGQVQEQGGEGRQVQGNQQEQQANEQVPFHEHPRFKEIVQQKNQFANELKALKAQFAQQSQQRTESQKREDALVSRLKGIDPEFGERFAKLDGAAGNVEQLMQKLQQMEMAQVRQQGVSMVNGLHETNKVSAEMRELYNSQIEAIIRNTPHATLDDLPEIYKSVHGKMSKIFDTMKRADRESYVKEKKQDAKAPVLSKGKQPSNQKSKTDWSKDPSEARSQMVERIRAKLAAGKQE